MRPLLFPSIIFFSFSTGLKRRHLLIVRNTVPHFCDDDMHAAGKGNEAFFLISLRAARGACTQDKTSALSSVSTLPCWQPAGTMLVFFRTRPGLDRLHPLPIMPNCCTPFRSSPPTRAPAFVCVCSTAARLLGAMFFPPVPVAAPIRYSTIDVAYHVGLVCGPGILRPGSC
ncbi:uncharacterized protein K452DRAFT_171619 [Aplosporella prunicola CBS 121167]|uniref:Uncharacterized protein n=1 Tax=Aplosporella prunicola CBS 121167 TaxID=1176127 RepID=A0A6A6BH45_9PEZI|nr:uncharacterized protein K452DRAFT_171619 [Aplosporella prunicola CBS 121167]KAF2143472.1 hypothetical protein K452DRAFT_171619 [Aplosporella prunicola CBS 121167]